MLVVIPIHSATHRIETLAKDILAKGKCENHVLHLLNRRVDEELTYTLGEQLSDHFLKVTTRTLADRTRTANVLGNDMFRAAFEFLWGYKPGPNEYPDPPMLYMSPDYRPSANNYLDLLQAEFFLKAARTLGRTLPGPEPKSRIYVGPVVFGSAFAREPEILNFLHDTIPWRERLMWQLMKGSVETKLVGGGKRSVIRKITEPQ